MINNFLIERSDLMITLDKINFTDFPDTSSPIDKQHLEKMQENIEKAINENGCSVEVAENNNIIIKFDGGLMIQTKKTRQVISDARNDGTMYVGSMNLGNWEEEFKEFYTSFNSISNIGGSRGVLLSSYFYDNTKICSADKTTCGIVNIYMNWNGFASIPIEILAIGFGTWK